MLIYLFLYL